LESLNGDADCCGEGILAKVNIHYDDTPKSLFAKSGTNNGLWLFSPYLCGTAQVEFFNYSYEWGARIWDWSGLVIGFFHLYNMLLQCGHIKRQIPFFEQVIDLFKDDIFKSGRPLLGAGAGAISAKKRAVFSNAFQVELKIISRPVNKKDFYSNRFKNASKRHALGEAKFMKERINTNLFQTVLEKPPKTAITFLDAMRSNLESDFEGKASASTLNYSAVLEAVSNFSSTNSIFPNIDRSNVSPRSSISSTPLTLTFKTSQSWSAKQSKPAYSQTANVLMPRMIKLLASHSPNPKVSSKTSRDRR